MPTQRLQITLCYCGTAFKGENWKFHLRLPKVREDLGLDSNSHGIQKRVLFCAKHLQWPQDGSLADFNFQHKDCPNVRISKNDLFLIANMQHPKELQKKQLNSSNQEEDCLNSGGESVDGVKRRRIEVTLDNSSDSESDFEPTSSSTPKPPTEIHQDKTEGETISQSVTEKKNLLAEKAELRRKAFIKRNRIRLQQKWSRAEAIECSQRAAHNDLVSRLNNKEADLKKLREDLTLLRAKQDLNTKLESQVKSLLEEKEESVLREIELRSNLKIETKKYHDEVKRSQEEEERRIKAENEIKNLQRTLRNHQDSLQQSSQDDIVVHLKCVQGRIVAKSLENNNDLNETVICFNEENSFCHHVRIKAKQIDNVNVKNIRSTHGTVRDLNFQILL